MQGTDFFADDLGLAQVCQELAHEIFYVQAASKQVANCGWQVPGSKRSFLQYSHAGANGLTPAPSDVTSRQALPRGSNAAVDLADTNGFLEVLADSQKGCGCVTTESWKNWAVA